MKATALSFAHRLHGAATWWLLLATTLLLALLPAPAQACSGGACVGAGPRLASVSSGRAGLLNTLYGSLLGQSSALNLSVGDWNAIATGDVSVLKTANALQGTLGVSSPTSALNTNATLAQVVAAMATAATGDGNTSLAAGLGNLAPALNVAGGTIRLGDLLNTDTGIGTTKINALELATGAVQLYNSKNVLTTPSAIHVSGSALGLGGLLNAVDLQAQVVEPPVFICGPQGSTFHTATVRLRLHLDLVNVPLNVSALTALGVAASVSLAQLDLNIVVARADGAIGLINAVASTLAVQVTPGVADIYLGTIPDTTFFDRTRAITLADVTPANIGSATITSLGTTYNLSIKASGVGHGQAPSQQTLNFTGPYPQVLTAYTGVGFTTNLINDLVSNLTITITPSMGATLDNLLLGTLRTIVRTGLTTTLGTVVSGLVNPLLETLGIRLGEVDVQVSGVYLSCSVSGNVYNDANHSSAQDSGELGIGSTLYAKLVASGTPGTAALTASVDPTTGNYSFPSVATGGYSLVICATNTQTDVTAAVPATWLATENPTLTRALTLATDTAGLRFGLYRGSKLTGTVFKDIGNGGGTANNGLRDGAEAGISGSTIKLTDSSGATLLTSDVSADQGGYTLWIPFANIGALKVAQTDSGDWVPTGGAAGTTAGTYTLAADSVAFTAASGVTYSGVNFAKVPANKFDTDGQQQTQPGKVVFYTHAYTAGTAGQLTFALATPAVPNNAGFSALLYEDANCNGLIDSSEAQLTAAKTVLAAQKVCVVAKVQIPVNASYGQQYPVALTATLAYANSAISGSQQRNDLTLIGDGSDLRLVKVADKATAASGDFITYTITYTNLGNAALSAMKIVDQTPSYTVLNAATCGTLPASGLTCGVTTQPGAGNAGKVEWTFTGTLASGGSGTVVLKVLLQ